ncbi:MAG: hypothetical protein C5B51_02815 [Terriglobia bacterium]|nr:MAG: hypothetical protein C5B51_02815 [Terriglobia bacterium]
MFPFEEEYTPAVRKWKSGPIFGITILRGQLMPTPKAAQGCDLSLRHTLATLAYRGGKALRGAPEGFSAFRAGEGSRQAGEILAHIGDLLDWVLSQAQGAEKWRNAKPQSWSQDTERFFTALKAFDDYLASGAELHAPPEKLFQGAIADALTHVGQIAMMRRIAGAPVLAENYSVAHIEAGRTGPDQAKPVMEFP